MSNQIETTEDVINFLEDIQSYVRDLLWTIQVNGDEYTKSEKFRSDLEHLKGVVSNG